MVKEILYDEDDKADIGVLDDIVERGVQVTVRLMQKVLLMSESFRVVGVVLESGVNKIFVLLLKKISKGEGVENQT